MENVEKKDTGKLTEIEIEELLSGMTYDDKITFRDWLLNNVHNS